MSFQFNATQISEIQTRLAAANAGTGEYYDIYHGWSLGGGDKGSQQGRFK